MEFTVLNFNYRTGQRGKSHNVAQPLQEV